MCSETVHTTPSGNISFPRSKLELLFAEARATDCPLITLNAVATMLGLQSQSSLTPVFGHHVNNETGSNSRRYLVAIAAAYNGHGIMVEVEWFDADLDTFKEHLASMRQARRHPPTHDIPPAKSTDEWRVADPVHISQGIAALHIHPPAPSNDPNTFQLRVSLSLARYPDEIDDLPVWIGLRQAFIVPSFTGCQPAEWHLADTIRKSANLITVQGPREGTVLYGTVLEQHTLTTLEYTTSVLPVVDLQLRSRKTDLEVVFEDPNAVSVNRQRVLQRFLGDCAVAAEDRQVTWSHARMVRRSGDEADI